MLTASVMFMYVYANGTCICFMPMVQAIYDTFQHNRKLLTITALC